MGNDLQFSVFTHPRSGRCGVKVYGNNRKPKSEWWIKPIYEAIEFRCRGTKAWFRRDGKYGYMDLSTREEIIPAEYAYPLYFSDGYAVTWLDYRAGVIDINGNTVIPFRYDEIHPRLEPIGKDGDEHIFRGFVCSCEDGTRHIFDENFQPDQQKEWENLDRKPYIADPDNEKLSVSELEDKIREDFRRLIQMGYNSQMRYSFSPEHRNEMDDLEERVKDSISDRRSKMNLAWRHNRENAKRIGRVNDLLMKAVRKAISLGKKTAESLQWMEKVSNQEHYAVNVYVYPYWQDDRSDYGYVPRQKNRMKERDRLIVQEDDLSELHIRNIIARMGAVPNSDGITSCFEHASYSYKPQDWNYRDLVIDGGQSWDELIHFPAYQDVYFLHPFHLLYCDFFDYSFEDLVTINDFRVEVKVELLTKEQDKR